MKNYYEILGLSTTATDHDIKRVFRRLAVLYHPDKNPSAEAEAFFKEVNEAYEILGDPIKRAYYNQLLTGTTAIVSQQPPAWHRDPAYRKRRESGYKPPPPGPSERMLFMRAMLGYAKLLSWIGCFCCLLIVADYLLPHRITEERVITTKEIAKMRLKSYSDLLITDKGHHFPVDYFELRYFPYQSKLKIYSSAVLGILVKVENQERSYQLNNLVTVYRNFVFGPCALFILSVMGFFFRKEIEFRFNIGVVLFLIFLLNIVFFFISRI